MSKKPKNPIFKYGGLRDLMHLIPRNERAKVRTNLARMLYIHTQTLYNWQYIRYDDKQEIKPNYLEIIAEYFDVEVEFLKSHPYHVRQEAYN